jgi:hypothetical protein
VNIVFVILRDVVIDDELHRRNVEACQWLCLRPHTLVLSVTLSCFVLLCRGLSVAHA